MSVDSVQSSNTGAYTLGGAALGAIGGGAYGYYSKPWLKEGAPNDAFYKTVAEKALEAKGEAGAAEKAGILINEALVNAKNADELAKAQTDYALKLVEVGLKDADEATKTNALSTIKSTVKGLVEGMEDSKLPNKAELLKQLEEAKSFSDCKPISVAVNKATIEATEGGFEAAKEGVTKLLKDEVKSLTEKGKSVAENVFDTSKKEFNFEGVAEDAKKQINEAMSSMKKSAALKWAAIGAAVLGVVGFIAAKCTAKSYPVAAAKLDEQA